MSVSERACSGIVGPESFVVLRCVSFLGRSSDSKLISESLVLKKLIFLVTVPPTTGWSRKHKDCFMYVSGHARREVTWHRNTLEMLEV